MIIKCRTQRALTFLNVPLKVLGIVLPHQRCLGLRESAVRRPIGIDQPAVEPCVFSTAEMGKNGKVCLPEPQTLHTEDKGCAWNMEAEHGGEVGGLE